MKKILVTGATGFIGYYVVHELLKLGHQVVASSSSAAKAAQCDWFGQVTYKPFDLSAQDEQADYYTYFGRPDAAIHLAWEGLPNYKSSFHTDINLPRHIAFTGNLFRHGLKDITVTGTCFEYGMREGALSEDMPALPANPYALAKDQLRRFLEDRAAANASVSFKWVRLFYMYGKGQNPKSLLSQLAQALRDGDTVFNMSGGEQVRDYLPVEKMAEYIVRIALQREVQGIFNGCSGQPITVRKLVEDYLAASGQQIALNLGFYPYPDYEPMRFWGDTRKLKTVIHHD